MMRSIRLPVVANIAEYGKPRRVANKHLFLVKMLQARRRLHTALDQSTAVQRPLSRMGRVCNVVIISAGSPVLPAALVPVLSPATLGFAVAG